jgi:predicted pyridoxine 5'-phosphate oxidase superfamily flavin-nucleotide-binding protein
LATCDGRGQPNVSPKEVFSVYDSQRLVIANIASPVSASNIAENPKVCVSFIDVFVQKGFKVTGTARNVLAGDADFAAFARPLEEMTKGRFPIRSVFVVDARAVEPIIAPSYLFYPAETNEASQIASAMQSYGVRSKNGDD